MIDVKCNSAFSSFQNHLDLASSKFVHLMLQFFLHLVVQHSVTTVQVAVALVLVAAVFV